MLLLYLSLQNSLNSPKKKGQSLNNVLQSRTKYLEQNREIR